MADKPGFYAILPASVRYDNELSYGARLLYCEITALANKHGFCYAGNTYFAELFLAPSTKLDDSGKPKKKSSATIRAWLKELSDQEHLLITFEQGRNRRKRRIYIVNAQAQVCLRGGASLLAPNNNNSNSTDERKDRLDPEPHITKIITEWNRLADDGHVTGLDTFDPPDPIEEDTRKLLRTRWKDQAFSKALPKIYALIPKAGWLSEAWKPTMIEFFGKNQSGVFKTSKLLAGGYQTVKTREELARAKESEKIAAEKEALRQQMAKEELERAAILKERAERNARELESSQPQTGTETPLRVAESSAEYNVGDETPGD